MRIIKYPADILRVKTNKVEKIDKNVEKIALKMLSIMRKNNGVGLASPQIGLKLSLFVIQERKDSQELIFINPQIKAVSKEKTIHEEGCLSIPGVFFEIERPKKIIIEALDLKGNNFTIKDNGFLARIIQHEMDHLEGKLFIDYISDLEREKLLKDYFKSNKRKVN